MIAESDLKIMARAKLKDSEILFRRQRYDSSLYLCGYAIEMALKSRICRSLKWADFPETPSEFKSLTSLKTHDLGVLLRLSGIENKIKVQFLAEWSVVAKWDPELRYKKVGSASQSDAADVIKAAKRLLRTI